MKISGTKQAILLYSVYPAAKVKLLIDYLKYSL